MLSFSCIVSHILGDSSSKVIVRTHTACLEVHLDPVAHGPNHASLDCEVILSNSGADEDDVETAEATKELVARLKRWLSDRRTGTFRAMSRRHIGAEHSR